MVTPTNRLSATGLRPYLVSCGYRSSYIESDVRVTDEHRAALAAFAHPPFDSRSACIATINGFTDPFSDVAACRPLGTPVVFVCFRSHLQWWTQGSTETKLRESVPVEYLGNFFTAHRDEFSPNAIYRAKTLARFDKQYQLEFVDAGLMPLVESQAGRKLEEMIEQGVQGTKRRLRWHDVSVEQGSWLLQANFWLLAAKILKDKCVPRFCDLDLCDLDEVYARLAKHYGSKSPVLVDTKAKREALAVSAAEISRRSHLGLVSTEALAYLYENALITRETRKDLGTHSTPAYLVDYIIAKLRDWIKEIPTNEQNVFEPACGHSAFLLAAMRLFGELLPPSMATPSARHHWLRARLHGCDIDSFALEIARLSLTLADVPNPNGWDLTMTNMFAGSFLSDNARAATIVLANPPFENFSVGDRKALSSQHVNKTAEMLWRIVTNMRPGSVLGVVVPQGLLHSQEVRKLRAYILGNFELGEICLFPDDVFTFSDAESAVILGRRLRVGEIATRAVVYNRVREPDIDSFKRSYRVTTSRALELSSFSKTADLSFLVPDLQEVWLACGRLPQFAEIADIGKGLDFMSEADPNFPAGHLRTSAKRRTGFARGFLKYNPNILTHELPKAYWMNLDRSVIRSSRHGTVIGIPQVLLNYAPVSRGPWRLKALLDAKGHPFTTRFLAVRPRSRVWPLGALWALCNSPFANAYVYATSSKRDILTGLIRRMPVPSVEQRDLAPVTIAVRAYFRSVRKLQNEQITPAISDKLRLLLWRVDAEVLRLYALPAHLECQVLKLFTGSERLGVPFPQEEYLPRDFNAPLSLTDLLAITADWEQTNEHRARLILKEENKTIRASEKEELARLQHLTDIRIKLVSPLPIAELEAIAAELKRKGVWVEA